MMYTYVLLQLIPGDRILSRLRLAGTFGSPGPTPTQAGTQQRAQGHIQAASEELRPTV